jgi:C4-dicarboxylate transporter DctM subunit
MMEAFILFLLVLGLLMLRVKLVAVLLILIVYVHWIWGAGEFVYIAHDMWSAIDREVFLALPLFLLCGAVMGKGGIARRLIRVMNAFTASLPGGLSVAAILTCGIFAALSGSSAVTLIAVGSIAYPALLAAGYDRPFAVGALATGGTLGVIIPPSLPLILFGITTETSITKLFIAGILPGLLLVTLLALYALIRNRNMKREPFSVTEVKVSLREGVWSLMMPSILLGGIYSGYFTPTESAAVALAYALLVEFFIHKELSFKGLVAMLVESSAMIGAFFPLLAVGISLNLIMVEYQVPGMMTDYLATIISDRVTFLIALNVLLLLMGTVLDLNSVIVILSPTLVTMAAAFGIDPIHLAIIIVVNLEIGFLTPPIGLNLIVSMTALKEQFGVIVRGVIPFIFVMIFGLLLITFIPEISLFLVR